MAKNLNRCVALFSALVATAVGLCACSSSDAGGNTSSKSAVAMGFAGPDITIWNDELALMRPIIEKAGYTFLTDDPQWNINQQVSDWQAWVNRGDVKAIMGFPVQADAMIPVTTAAKSAGIPVFGYLQKWAGTSGSVVVDSYKGGYDLAVNSAKAIVAEHNQDSTLVVVGDRSSDFSANATKGLIAGLKSQLPSAHVVELSGTTQQNGYDLAKAQLTSDPKSKVWLGYTNDVITGVYNALLDSGVRKDDPSYYLASRDATNATLDLIKIPNSIYRTSIIVPAEALAQADAKLLIAGAKGEKTSDITVPSVFVTAANADKYYVSK
ncbi:MAG: substrate-binding domain-containing protein [Gordonia sp. (in: high G+C Gram-positive bacteria)]